MRTAVAAGAALIFFLLSSGGAMAVAASGEQEDAIALAKTALADGLKTATGAIELVKAEAVEWSDASLGCPEKDMMYAQVITPGYKVVLKADGRSYAVHVGAGRAVVCPPLGGPAATPPARPMAGAAASVYALARKDLAARLKVDVAAISVRFVRPTTWPDAGLGCAEPGKTYAATPVKGFLIELESAGKTYRYHADMAAVRPCGGPEPAK